MYLLSLFTWFAVAWNHVLEVMYIIYVHAYIYSPFEMMMSFQCQCHLASEGKGTYSISEN